MSARALYIVAYDVRDRKRLRLSLLVAKRYATGGQKSVFECFLTDVERATLMRDMTEILDPHEDRFFLLRLDRRASARTLGIARPPGDPNYFYFD